MPVPALSGALVARKWTSGESPVMRCVRRCFRVPPFDIPVRDFIVVVVGITFTCSLFVHLVALVCPVEVRSLDDLFIDLKSSD